MPDEPILREKAREALHSGRVRQLRHKFPRELDDLAVQVPHLAAESGDVTARSRETLHQSRLDGVGDPEHDAR